MSDLLRIEDVAKLNANSITKRDKYSEIKYLDTSNITRNVINQLQLLTEDFPSRARRKVKDKSIIYSTVRPNQEHYGIFEHREDIDDIIVSTGFVTIDVISQNIDSKYLYYKLTQPDVTRHLQTIAENSVSAYPSIKPESIGNLNFRFPKLRLQQKIASVLSTLDDKIELNNKINDNLEQQAKLLYDYWFVQFEFPNEDGKPYKSSGGKMVYNKQLKRDIPEGWEVKELREIIEFNPKLDIKRNTIANYVDMYSIPNEGYMITDIQKKEYSGGIKFQNNDVLLARITPCLENGKTALVKMLDDMEVAFGSTEFIVMRGINRDFSSFISCLARTTYFRHYAIANMIGTSGRKRVDTKILELYKIALPKSINLLTSFEKIISKSFDIMGTNQEQNQQLSSLRDWLLPMLMNGQVKVE
ncbi:restriction endonuclease subunit S [Massilibacteroides vaginae]|uniref:restriction endonuclease subunit S n=1 Tax=Massilibacteroides vaginae TaxID=1673718 RepID=UPI000A1CDE56|nr:restriction endonuclease subunit S [Massilibacteroides vaginae]